MPHGLILGPTESGKTRLAKIIAKKARLSGVPVLILDPSNGRWPDSDYQTGNIDEFMRVVFQNERCLLIIDEAGEAIGRAQSDATRGRVSLATRSRHKGHSALFIAQRANLIPVNVRTQCVKAWIFRQHFQDLKDLSREMCNPHIMKAAELGRGHCIHVDTYGRCTQIDVFSLDKVPMIRA